MNQSPTLGWNLPNRGHWTGCYAETDLARRSDRATIETDPTAAVVVLPRGESLYFATGLDAEFPYKVEDLLPSDGLVLKALTPGRNIIAVAERDVVNPRINIPNREARFTAGRNSFISEAVQASFGAAVLRFMDWGATNSNQIRTWEERTHPNNPFQSTATHGCSYETMIDYAEANKATPWICLPPLVDEDYFVKFCEWFLDYAPPGMKVYLEHGNEGWNFAAGFRTFFNRIHNLPDLPFQEQEKHKHPTTKQAHLSGPYLRAAKEILGDRVKTVWGCKSDETWRTQRAVDQFERDGYKPDVFAFTNYFAGTDSEVQTTKHAANNDLDGFFAEIEASFDDGSQHSLLYKHNVILAAAGIKGAFYEGGSHAAVYHLPKGQRRDELDAFCDRANRDPRMASLTAENIERTNSAMPGAVQCHFSLSSTNGQFFAIDGTTLDAGDSARNQTYTAIREAHGLYDEVPASPTPPIPVEPPVIEPPVIEPPVSEPLTPSPESPANTAALQARLENLEEDVDDLGSRVYTLDQKARLVDSVFTKAQAFIKSFT